MGMPALLNSSATLRYSISYTWHPAHDWYTTASALKRDTRSSKGRLRSSLRVNTGQVQGLRYLSARLSTMSFTIHSSTAVMSYNMRLAEQVSSATTTPPASSISKGNLRLGEM